MTRVDDAMLAMRAFVLPKLTDEEQRRLQRIIDEALDRAGYIHMSEADRAETFFHVLGSALIFMKRLPLAWQAQLAKMRH